MNIFEDMRRANEDWYTANPLDRLTDEELQPYADEAGITVEELRAQSKIPTIEMTCPLCGLPSTHLVGCKGCGGDAWSEEFHEVFLETGGDFADPIREHLREFLAICATDEQIEHALPRAWNIGGCMVCPECWRNTLPTSAFYTCPLYLVANRQLYPDQLPTDLMMHIHQTKETALGDTPERAFQTWWQTVQGHWLEHWNTRTGEEHGQVGKWRAAILLAVFKDSVGSDDEAE
jgi:hypothetical protein